MGSGEAEPRDPKLDPKRGDVLWADEDGDGAVYVVKGADSRTVGYYAVSLDDAGFNRRCLASLDDFRRAFKSATVLRTAP